MNIRSQAGEEGARAAAWAAERWFLQSGIQFASGGVARYYRQDTGDFAPVSSEISGYFVTTLFSLHDLSGSKESLAAALRAADFLAGVAWDRETGMLRLGPSAEDSNLACFFDCGIVVSALLEAWRRSGCGGYRDAAQRLGESMLKDFGGEDGSFHPFVKTSTRTPLAYGGWWSRRPGCYQLKAAKSWLELSAETDSTAFRDGYERLLAYTAPDDATFLNSGDRLPDTMDRLHAYGYYLEGLLPVADRAEPRLALAAGMERMNSKLRRMAPSFVRSDVCAQLLRLRLLASTLGVHELDEASAEEEAAAIRGFQIESGNQRANGGFSFGRWDGQMTPFVNPVSTAFCVQALTMWEEYKGGHLATDWRKVI